MVAPAIVAAIISAVASKYASDQATKQGAMQSAGAGAGAQKQTLEAIVPTFQDALGAGDDPFAGEGFGEGGDPGPGPQLETQPVNTGAGGTPMPQPADAPPSAIGRQLDQSDRQAEVTQKSLDDMNLENLSQTPPPEQPEGNGTGMTSLEMAQLGLMLGSELFKREKGPAPPPLPGSSFSPMRPVFMGR